MGGNGYVYGLDGREGCEDVCLPPNSWSLHILNIYSFLYVSRTSIKCFFFLRKDKWIKYIKNTRKCSFNLSLLGCLSLLPMELGIETVD